MRGAAAIRLCQLNAFFLFMRQVLTSSQTGRGSFFLTQRRHHVCVIAVDAETCCSIARVVEFYNSGRRVMLPLATFMQRVAYQPYANQVFFGSDWRKANLSRVTLTTTRLQAPLSCRRNRA